MRYLLTLLLLFFTVPSWAVTIRTGCANPCGVEEIVAGGSTICTISIGADIAPLVVTDAHYLVHHADGDQLVDAAGTPVSVPAGSSADFPLTIATDASDAGTLTMLAVADVTQFGRPAMPTFPQQLAIVPVSTCNVTTTTQVVTTTTSTTTTTLQTRLGHRMGVCFHNGQPKKCD